MTDDERKDLRARAETAGFLLVPARLTRRQHAAFLLATGRLALPSARERENLERGLLALSRGREAPVWADGAGSLILICLGAVAGVAGLLAVLAGAALLGSLLAFAAYGAALALAPGGSPQINALRGALQTYYKAKARAAWCCPVLKGSDHDNTCPLRSSI